MTKEGATLSCDKPGASRLGACVLFAVLAFYTIGNFVPKEERVESGLWPDDLLTWGLDLQGGMHWVVGVDLPEAEVREVHFLRDGVERVLVGVLRERRIATVEELHVVLVDREELGPLGQQPIQLPERRGVSVDVRDRNRDDERLEDDVDFPPRIVHRQA